LFGIPSRCSPRENISCKMLTSLKNS
jgi:hypothetical protein